MACRFCRVSAMPGLPLLPLRRSGAAGSRSCACAPDVSVLPLSRGASSPSSSPPDAMAASDSAPDAARLQSFGPHATPLVLLRNYCTHQLNVGIGHMQDSGQTASHGRLPVQGGAKPAWQPVPSRRLNHQLTILRTGGWVRALPCERKSSREGRGR